MKFLLAQLLLMMINTAIFAQTLHTVIPNTPVPQSSGVVASFSLATAATTSAGVFRNDSILVKSLWSSVHYRAGTYPIFWDGTDDNGNIVLKPDADYKIKVLSHNVTYTWQGTIGNSSDSMTGNSKHRGYSNCMTGLSFSANFGYFSTGYSEGSSSLGKFNINKPNKKIIIFPKDGNTGNVNYTTTDGITVYWGVVDPFATSNSFVIGTKVVGDTENNFSRGTAYTITHGKTYAKTIARLNIANSAISGLAVQKRGAYLFVSRKNLNLLQVLNKTTGELIRQLNYPLPRAVSVDDNNNLWMVTAINTVNRFRINADGTLSASDVKLTSLQSPIATQVSPDGTTLAVADGDTTQQVKFFNTTTGKLLYSLGSAGGYLKDATVNDYKFDFNENDIPRNTRPFIAFQTNGSFWVNDAGNFRVQHYNSDRSFIDRVMYMGSSYSTWCDKNNIRRVFAGYLEFEIDYQVQRLTGATGWRLVKNWGANVSSAYNDFEKIKYPVTLSNGRTYAFIKRTNNLHELIELPAEGTTRFTGVLLSINKILCSDGSLQDYTTTGRLATYTRYSLNGFDPITGNPQWSTLPELLAAGTLDDFAPTAVGNPIASPKTQVFSTTNKIVLYNYATFSNNKGPVYFSGYHLGVMPKGSTDNYLFLTARSTHRNYIGPFPPGEWYDIGNGVNEYSGGNVNIVDRNIFTSYHGEFWKASQTNKYNHYYDNGLLIGQFGITRPETSGHAPAMMAGNALTPVFVKDSKGDLYLYHGDESDHSGVHRWKITGLNSIREQVVSVRRSSTIARPPAQPMDLMTGLPFDVALETNTAGWTRTPAKNVTVGYNWKVNTSRLKFDPLKTPDIYIEYAQPMPGTYNVSRDLGDNKFSSGWTLTGNINFGDMPNGLGNNSYLEVLDVNDKIITTISTIKFSEAEGMYCNTRKALAKQLPAFSKTNPFTLTVTDTGIKYTYGGYNFLNTPKMDPTADWARPKTVRFRFATKIGYPNYGITCGVSDLNFSGH